jgi:hypothetical protein
MPTYADRYVGDVSGQQALTFPSAAAEETPMAAEFPNAPTYSDLHRNDPVAVWRTPTFPSSANETTSMADEGLVPGVNSATAAYAGTAQSGN